MVSTQGPLFPETAPVLAPALATALEMLAAAWGRTGPVKQSAPPYSKPLRLPQSSP